MNYAPAQFELGKLLLSDNTEGKLLLSGNNVSKHPEEAVKWYIKAALQNYADAQYSLALCIKNGIGTKKDKAESALWLKKAAEQNHVAAKLMLEQLEFLQSSPTNENVILPASNQIEIPSGDVDSSSSSSSDIIAESLSPATSNTQFTSLPTSIFNGILDKNPLINAIRDKQPLERIVALLKENPYLLKKTSDWGIPPLSIAVTEGKLDIVALLINQGADIIPIAI